MKQRLARLADVFTQMTRDEAIMLLLFLAALIALCGLMLAATWLWWLLP